MATFEAGFYFYAFCASVFFVIDINESSKSVPTVSTREKEAVWYLYKLILLLGHALPFFI